MNVLDNNTFNELIKTKEGINKIIVNMKPYLMKITRLATSKVANSYGLNPSNIYDDIFQTFQIALWEGLINYNPNKNSCPFSYISKHIKFSYIKIVRLRIKKLIKDSKYISYDSLGDCVLNKNYALEKISRDEVVSSLPKKYKELYLKLINKGQLSNLERTKIKNYISKNRNIKPIFKKYFNSIGE